MILFWLFLLFTPASVFAQDTSPSPTPNLVKQYQDDYNYQYSLYQQSYLDYNNKKQVYTKYGTVTTQKDKFDAAKTAIINRNNTFVAYLMMLRVSLDTYQSANPTETEKQKIELSKWEDYFREQNTIVTAINNDNDLKTWAAGFQTKYIDIQQAIYTAKTQGQINQRHISLNLIRQLMDSVKNSPNISTSDSQWYSQLSVQADLVDSTFQSTLALTKKPQYQLKFSNFYPNVKDKLNQADGYLNQMLGNLKVIITKNYHE